jgi:hypothetical protein
MMSQTRMPDALFEAVKHDLQPVRPLATPARRALALLPVAIVLLVGMPLFWHWQTNALLAPRSLWTLSAVESVLSLVVLAAAFREAIPGRELSTRALIFLAMSAAVGFLVVNATTRSEAAVPVETSMLWIRECISMTMTFSVPALIAPAWLVARALPNRPALTGALCGLAVGGMGDAGLRLFCWDGGYSHVMLAHGGAIAILVAMGALGALLVERWKDPGKVRS